MGIRCFDGHEGRVWRWSDLNIDYSACFYHPLPPRLPKEYDCNDTFSYLNIIVCPRFEVTKGGGMALLNQMGKQRDGSHSFVVVQNNAPKHVQN